MTPVMISDLSLRSKGKESQQEKPENNKCFNIFYDYNPPLGLSDCSPFSSTLHLSKLKAFPILVHGEMSYRVPPTYIIINLRDVILGKSPLSIGFFICLSFSLFIFSVALLFLNVSLWSKANLHGSTGKAQKRSHRCDN